MTTCLGNNCSFGLTRVSVVNFIQFLCLIFFLFGFKSRILSLPIHDALQKKKINTG